MMFADPAATAVASPELFTVAIAVAELLQVTTRPVSVLPAASFSTTLACVVWPTVMLDEFSDTATDATGAGGAAATVSAACPVFPSAVAMMFADPAATAVASPELFTVAIAVAELLHVTARPVSVAPLASLSTALACVV
jgi:hypothetical protein